ncbi:MAG TPA: DUF2905 domain-containing protein [Terriglobales bacterium]|nr:DUF2905 domain-containing protein [Terriglobales bacterium]
MGGLGKLLILAGGLLILLGLLFVVAGRWNLPLGRLPGDISYRGKHTVFYFPLTSSILVSIVLSLLFYLISRISK